MEYGRPLYFSPVVTVVSSIFFLLLPSSSFFLSMAALWNTAGRYILSCAFLWSPCVADADIIFCSWVTFFFFFLGAFVA